MRVIPRLQGHHNICAKKSTSLSALQQIHPETGTSRLCKNVLFIIHHGRKSTNGVTYK